MTSTHKAPFVCANCKARKKACDKQLPDCGHCAKRGLQCHYRTVSPSTSDEGLSNGSAEIPFVLFSTKAQHAGKSPRTSREESASPPGIAPASGQQPLDMTLHFHLLRTLQDVGMSFLVVVEQYLRTFNQWLPAVCPSTFLALQSTYIILPADKSTLVLAICLIVARPPIPPARQQSRGITEPIYMFVKMLFAQTQAEVSASVPLVQTGVLLAAYEYSCGRPDAAYISLNTCVGMAQTLGLDRYSKLPDDPHGLKTREAWNVWWSIVILQRLSLIELRGQAHCPTASFPDDNCPFPCDLSVGFSTLSTWGANDFEEMRKSTSDAINDGYFARQAQAARFVDEILKVTSPTTRNDVKLLELERIDRTLQEFLRLFMEQHSSKIANTSTAVMATLLRSLFALHENVLTILAQSNTSEPQDQLVELHQGTISTYLKMVVDIGHHHMTLNEASPAPCCIYSARTALKHAESRHAVLPHKVTANDVATIRAMEQSLTRVA